MAGPTIADPSTAPYQPDPEVPVVEVNLKPRLNFLDSITSCLGTSASAAMSCENRKIDLQKRVADMIARLASQDVRLLELMQAVLNTMSAGGLDLTAAVYSQLRSLFSSVFSQYHGTNPTGSFSLPESKTDAQLQKELAAALLLMIDNVDCGVSGAMDGLTTIEGSLGLMAAWAQTRETRIGELQRQLNGVVVENDLAMQLNDRCCHPMYLVSTQNAEGFDITNLS